MWSVPAILLFTKSVNHKKRKMPKIQGHYLCFTIKSKKKILFWAFTRRYENYEKEPPFFHKKPDSLWIFLQYIVNQFS